MSTPEDRIDNPFKGPQTEMVNPDYGKIIVRYGINCDTLQPYTDLNFVDEEITEAVRISVPLSGYHFSLERILEVALSYEPDDPKVRFQKPNPWVKPTPKRIV